MQRTRTFRGSYLRELRNERKWSQSKLARKINAHVTSISDWERGANEPSGRHIASLSQTFEVGAERFYENGATADEDEEADLARDLFNAIHAIVSRARVSA